VSIYGLTGPALDAKGYLRLRGDLNLAVPYLDKPCQNTISAVAYWGIKADFSWDFVPLKDKAKIAGVKILGKLPDKLPISSIYNKETLIKQWSVCLDKPKPPFMEIQGSDILKTVYSNTGEVISTTYTIKNTGDTAMNWTASAFADGITSVTPSSGSLAKDQTATVTVSVNTGKISYIGAYKSTVALKNLYADDKTSQANNGTSNRSVSVTIAAKLAAPVMNTPQFAKDSSGNPIPTAVDLSWSYPDPLTLRYVSGYYIYKNDIIIATLTKPDSAYRLANLTPNSVNSFKIKAYGSNGVVGDLSNVVSLQIPCAYSVYPTSLLFDASGGNRSISISTSSGCNWSVINVPYWVTITSNSGGTGNGTINYSVSPNTVASSRNDNIVIADKTLSIRQYGASCTYSISPTAQSFNSSGGTGSVNVTMPEGCNWTVSSNSSWLSITSGSTGSGSGAVYYSVSQNPISSSRTGIITIAGKTFTVTQAGVSCTYSLSSATNSVDSSGGSGNISVTTPSGCNWTATANGSWINISSGTGRTGSGIFYYSIDANISTSPRTSIFNVYGQTFTINQSGLPCTYVLNSTEKAFESGGGNASLSLAALGGCNWTAASNASWITITSGNSGSGSAYVYYSVAANTGTGSRSGILTIAGKTFTVTQSGIPCSYSISQSNQSVDSSGATGYVGVTTPGGCNWTAASNASWITITSGNSGSGNAYVYYSVAANTATSSRTGTLTIAGQTFTVTQSGVPCTYSISPASRSFDLSGATGTISVTSPNGCAWNAINNSTSWVSITSGSSGNGNGTVYYSVASNSTINSRTGTITIAGQTFTIQQSGVSCTYAIDSTGKTFESGGGNASVSVTSPGGCNWTAASNDSWINITSGNSGNGNAYVYYSVAANTATSARTGTLSIAGQTFTVMQAGITCSYSISSSSQSFTSSAGTGSVNVTSPGGCNWTAVSSDTSWLNITAGNSGNGNGTVSYSVAQNTGGPRTGTLTIAGNTFTITQSEVIVNFPDKNLEAVIRQAISKPLGDIFASDLQGLTSLNASGKSIANIEGLQYCTNLTTLFLTDNQISNISVIAGLTKLTRLYLYNNQISDISPLAGLTNLTELNLQKNQISNIGALAGLTNLAGLRLDINQISDISALAGLTKLTELGLGNNQISDISALAGLTNLIKLELNYNQISNISALALTKLTWLNLKSNQISNINGLAGLTNLTWLELQNNQIIDISALAGLTKLTQLRLDANQISNINGLVGLTNLTWLELGQNQISNINELAGLTNLAWLGLGPNQINNINILSVLTKLDRLNLYNNQISDISALAGLTNLTDLILNGNQINNISALTSLTKLNQLGLGNNQISNIGTLAGLTNLTNLLLYYNQISDISPLVNNSGIGSGDTIYLESNPLSTTSCTYIPQLQNRGVTVTHNCP